MNVSVRPGTEADLPAIHRLVGELADYVGESAAFTATLEDYRSDLEAGFFRTLVAQEGDKIIGMTLYYFVYSTWKGRMIYLEDFVIAPAYRRRGVGQQLWDALKEKGRERRCKLLKWQVVDSNSEAMKFYLAQDATIEQNWYNGKLDL